MDGGGAAEVMRSDFRPGEAAKTGCLANGAIAGAKSSSAYRVSHFRFLSSAF